jgi:hypothetical protein
MTSHPDHESRFARACDGRASAGELAELHALLKSDPAALDAWLRYTELHGELAGGTILTRADRGATVPIADHRPRASATPRAWFGWPWLPQAAAGLVVGLLAATVMWAYVRPTSGKTSCLLDEDFENPAVPLAVRTALETGIWRGDAAEIVGEQEAVRPSRGRHMMRLLRADYDGKAKPAGGHIAVAYRLIDLRPYRSELADGGAVVEVSARFNAREFPAAERYGCAISLYALDEESVPDRAGRLGTTLTSDALAMARSSSTQLDRDPATWQRLTTELRLPGNAEFLVVRLHINQVFESTTESVFTGSYVDEVRVSLTRRAPLP